MTEEEQAAFDTWLAEISRDAPPYKPTPGQPSLLAGYDWFRSVETREQKLAQPIREFTILWLAWELAIAGQRSFDEARAALVNAIPDGEEDILDDGMGFIVPFDQAAIALGIDPFVIPLRPEKLHS